ncbi:MAG: hypothetical protein HYZ42_04425, partial [Bacteroidetes bacterium]|nr:hypothetical protein [Bacteroidota bacterium]
MANNYFGFDLGYDKSDNQIIGNQLYANPQFNGNIEGMVWKSKGDGEKRKYDFGYDAANRLMKADFTQYTGGTFNQTANINYDVKIGDDGDPANNNAYDANGNIKRMQQWGWKLTGSTQVDDLHYDYQANSNKLAKVTDFISVDNKLGDFKDGNNGNTDDYFYDINGNMNLDNNKAISSITHNYLNLPSVITVTGKGTITYSYDASGIKLAKLTTDNSISGKTITTTTRYMGGLVYESKTTFPPDPNSPDYTDRLQFAGHEEGRIRFIPVLGSNPAAFAYDYFVKDHLGNVRMILTEEVQEDQYPAATMEDGAATTEESFYGNLPDTRVDVSWAPGYPPNSPSGNAKVA